jgi:predicted permease
VRPLPFPGAETLVTMFNTYPKAAVERDGSSLANYYDRRGNIPAFSHISVLRYGTAIIGEAGSPERVEVLRVSPEFFATLGVAPIIGRAFTEEETTYQTDGVAILTDSYWRRHFKADPNVLGREIRVDGFQRLVVGVLPPNYRYLSSKAQLYFPLSSNPEDRGPNQRHSGGGGTDLIARLKPGNTLPEAQAQIDANNGALAEDTPQAKEMADAGFRTLLVPLHADHVKSVRAILLLMQAGVLFLLLIGGVNLVNLLLIRASSRAKELALRQSLGANRQHVVMQAMVETVLLTLVGGLAGLAVGAGGIRLLAVLGVDQLPLGARVAFDGRVALITLAGAVVTGLAVGLPIAWFNLRSHLASTLQSESRGGTITHAAQRLRHGFVVAQIGLAFVLLAGAGLLGMSLRRAMAVSPGFRPDHILTGQISLPWKNYQNESARLAFAERLLGDISHQPGVTAAGVINNVPLSGRSGKSAVTVKGHVKRPGESPRGCYSYGVAGNYFTGLGIPLRDGRFLDSADSHREERVCVVDEDFARFYWPQGRAIGQRLFEGPEERKETEAFTIVGVVGAVKQADITENHGQGAVYFPYRYRAENDIFVVSRTSQSPEFLGNTLQKVVRAVEQQARPSFSRRVQL